MEKETALTECFASLPYCALTDSSRHEMSWISLLSISVRPAFTSFREPNGTALWAAFGRFLAGNPLWLTFQSAEESFGRRPDRIAPHEPAALSAALRCDLNRSSAT